VINNNTNTYYSGAAEKMNTASTHEQYGALIQRIDDLDISIRKEIEKDINRTFPGRIDAGRDVIIVLILIPLLR
jgi:hypothetical protein